MARVHGRWLAFGLLLGMSSVWANPVLVAAEDDWAPYCALDKESGQPQGLAPALVKAVFAIEGIALEFRTIPFARCMHEAKSDKVLACERVCNAGITSVLTGSSGLYDTLNVVFSSEGGVVKIC